MSNTLKFGNGQWGTKVGSALAYNDLDGNFKPLPFNFTRSTSGTRINKDGLIEVVTNNKPRIDFKDDAKGALLLEPTRSNLIAYSNKFDTYWSLIGAGTGSAPAITSNSIISPDGTLNASEVVLNVGVGATTSDKSSIEVSHTVTQGIDYAISFYLKGKNNGDQLIIGQISGSYELITLTTEWKRYSVIQSAGTSPRSVMIGVRQGIFGTLNSNVEFYIYGAQLEVGSYSTSYIPTQGSAVTRVADVCNNGGNEQVINSTEGVLYYESKVHSLTGDKAISVSTGSYNDSISIGVYGGVFQSRIRQGGNFINFISLNGVNLLNNNKIAIKYSTSNIKIFVNGVLKSNNSGVTYSSILKKISFTRGDSADFYYGEINDLRYYNTALTDAELIALTTI